MSEPTAPSPRPLAWWHTFRSWPRWARIPVYLLLALVLLLVLVTAAAYVTYRQPLPQTDGEATLPGLAGQVEVLRDEHGIPHLYADSDADLLQAQGYVHAQERFFEMDVRRHVTAGRLSELFGAEGLETDKLIRTMGWRRVAEQELALVSDDTRTALEAYAEGVNAYLGEQDAGDLAVEYSVLRLSGLDYTPEPWTPVDSLAWLKAMAWDLRGNMTDEIDRVVAALDHDDQRLAQLWPGYDYERNAPIVTEGSVVGGTFDQAAPVGTAGDGARPGVPVEATAALVRLRDSVQDMPALLGRGEGLGSNSWVVAGEKSATGQPLLANDPHLGVSMPGIWMQMGLHCRERSEACTLDVGGFTFSGVPGVVIGHNADVAWGFTNLGPDVTDLYLEKVSEDTWEYDGERRPLQVRTEIIKVRGADDFSLRVRRTAHGPLISDVFQPAASVGANAQVEGDDPEAAYAVALAWTALQPSTTADAILELNRAGDWEQFRAAAARFAVPAQNLVYADREGHIGYQAPGQVPIRQKGHDGRTPAAGWLPENDWTGKYVPFEALPSVLDPAEGFVVTANQAVVGPDYPYQLTQDWDRGYRAQRIRELLQAEADVTVEEMAEIQLDEHNPMAPVLVPYLTDIDLRSVAEETGQPLQYYRDGQDLLAEWDHQDSVDSAAAAYFNVVWANLLRLTFADDLRERIHPQGSSRWMQVVTNLLERPADPFWDDRATEDVVEVRDDVLRAALVEARDELTRLRAVRADTWTWGHLHRLELEHATLGQSGIGLLERLFNRGGDGIGGGSSVVNATSWNAAEGYTVTAAPSMRMVVSMADLDASRWVNLTGVSGHPASDHYDDQVEPFVRGETLAWPWSREAVEEAEEDRLLLTPPD